MDTIEPIRFVAAFIFVISLIGVLALAVKRYGTPKFLRQYMAMKNAISPQEGGRISVVEVRYLDPKRKLVLIRRDDVEHLLLVAGERELVIETGIKNDER